MAKNRVPVYSRNAQSLNELPLYYIGEAEASEMIRDKKAVRVTAKHKPLKIQLLQLAQPDCNSPCAISFAEMEANAGLTGSAGYIRRVQEKIAAWNSVGDGRLVCS